MLVYGPAGSGKTRFGGTLNLDERTAPVLFLNAVGNPVSLRDYDPQPYVVDVESLRDVSYIFNFLRTQRPDHPFRQQLNIPEDVVFKSVVLDTLTEMHRMITCEVAGMPYEFYTRDLSSETPVDFSESPKLEYSHWQQVLTRTLNVVSLFLRLPMHVVLIAQENRLTDEEGKEIGFEPLFQGQSRRYVPTWAEIVAHIQRRSSMVETPGGTMRRRTISVMRFSASDKYYAKNQVSIALGKEMEQPTVTKILDLIEGKTTESSDQDSE